MTGSDTTSEDRLRQMFRQAADQISPSTPGPGFDARPPRTHRPTTLRRSLGVALCAVVAGAITIAVHPWGASQGVGLGDGTGSDGVLVAVASNGAIELLSPDSGAVLSTLVGPSPVDTSGRHLRQPLSVTADPQFAYVAYEYPNPVIESIPLSGGTPTYMTAGLDPSVSPDGTELAYQPAGSTGAGDVVVRDLTTGSQQTINLSNGATLEDALPSWSPERHQSWLHRRNVSVGPTEDVGPGNTSQPDQRGCAAAGAQPVPLGHQPTLPGYARRFLGPPGR